MTNTYIAFDLETTGLRPMSDRILEIGAVMVEEGEVIGSYETFIDCGISIPPHITQLTGITEKMTAGSPQTEEAVRGFLEFSGGQVLLGHNLPFDYSFMKRNVVNLGLDYERDGLDTLKIARFCLPELESRSLDRLSAYFGIPQEHHHRALDDALTAARLYERLKEEFGERRPELFEPVPMVFKVKKESPITNSQKRYLRDLLKYHRIENNVKIEALTKNEASRMIDGIILQYGKIMR
ncbi:MAG: 3'-5' exonuclease [Lachnospiraceae bacterium]|nr:3'-5' exonuclease [Lachnospiraceae bacterium]